MERAMIGIDGLAAFRARMEQLELEAAARRGLLGAGAHVAESVRALLSTPPGGPHAAPWLRSGALRDSIAVGETDSGAVVASTSPVAVHQELGTWRIPPRPFLAPVAVAAVDGVAARVADAVRGEALRGETMA
jgi:hypothetical protein